MIMQAPMEYEHPDPPTLNHFHYDEYFTDPSPTAYKSLIHRFKKHVAEWSLGNGAHRYLLAVLRIIYSEEVACELCHQDLSDLSLKDLVLLISCGHLLCQGHCGEGDCPMEDCHGSCDSQFRIRASHIRGRRDGEIHPWGTKMGMILKYIHDTEPNDRILVFVQTDAVRKRLGQVLKGSHIPFTDLKSGTMSKNLASFQQTYGKPSDKVLILNIGDASAAGR